MPRFLVPPNDKHFRYSLQGSTRKFICPRCFHKTFSRYVDLYTGEYVAPQYGRCDRELKCRYHLNPLDDIKSNYLIDKEFIASLNVDYENIPPDFIDRDKAISTLRNGDCNLVKYLKKYFNNQLVKAIIKRYGIGTDHSMWDNGTVFWQIDKDRKLRTGKIMVYDEETGKRVKHPVKISWVHKNSFYTDKENFNLKQVFFGEHLLNPRVSTYHIVESEKTAVIMSLFNPKKAILATGGIQNINREKLLPFKGKKLLFYPDKGEAVDVWKYKLGFLSKEFNIKVISVINYLPLLEEGEDIADYYLKKHKIPPFLAR